MQMQTPELPHRIAITILIIVTSHLVITVGGGWALYRASIEHTDATAADIIGRLSEGIDRNGERIERLAVRVDRNGELIAQLRERMAALEVRLGAIDELVRFFHPPGDEGRQGDP